MYPIFLFPPRPPKDSGKLPSFPGVYQGSTTLAPLGWHRNMGLGGHLGRQALLPCGHSTHMCLFASGDTPELLLCTSCGTTGHESLQYSTTCFMSTVRKTKRRKEKKCTEPIASPVLAGQTTAQCFPAALGPWEALAHLPCELLESKHE